MPPAKTEALMKKCARKKPEDDGVAEAQHQDRQMPERGMGRERLSLAHCVSRDAERERGAEPCGERAPVVAKKERRHQQDECDHTAAQGMIHRVKEGAICHRQMRRCGQWRCQCPNQLRRVFPGPITLSLLSSCRWAPLGESERSGGLSLSAHGREKGHGGAMGGRGAGGSILTIGRYGAGITWPQLLQVRRSSEPKKR